MKRLVIIDACVRDDHSRTRQLSSTLIEILEQRYNLTRIDLSKISLKPINLYDYLQRKQGIIDPEILSYAQDIATADRLMIIAPFWDMSFPAMLKVFLEQVSIQGIMFSDSGSSFVGHCRATKLLYVTTRGWEIETGSLLEQATPYLKALSTLWGIPEVITLAAIGMDCVDYDERKKRIEHVRQEGIALCKSF